MEAIVSPNLEAAEESKGVKSKITDYFSKATGKNQDQTAGWLKTISETSRQRFKHGMPTLNQTILEGIKSGNYWSDSISMKGTRNEDLEQDISCDCDLDKGTVVDNKSDSYLSEDMKEKVPLQDQRGKPVLFGSDVVALYPNLDDISVAAIAAKTVTESSIKFENIRYSLLIIYLFGIK